MVIGEGKYAGIFIDTILNLHLHALLNIEIMQTDRFLLRV